MKAPPKALALLLAAALLIAIVPVGLFAADSGYDAQAGDAAAAASDAPGGDPEEARKFEAALRAVGAEVSAEGREADAGQSGLKEFLETMWGCGRQRCGGH